MSTYQNLSFSTNLDLSWAIPYTGGSVVCDINDLNPTVGGLSVMLPFASSVSRGAGFVINNISTHSFTVIDVTTDTVATFASGDVKYLYLVDTATAQGQWRVVPWGGGTNAITALTAQSTDSSLTITNGVITPSGGTINFRLPSSLTSLKGLNVQGLVVGLINSGVLTFSSVVLAGDGSNIIVANPDGSGGAPTISLTPTVAVTSVAVTGMTLDTHGITAHSTPNSGNLVLSSGGTNGVINLNGLTITQAGRSPFIPKAWCCFKETLGTVVFQDGQGVSSVTKISTGQYQIAFTTPMVDTHYGFAFGVQSGSLTTDKLMNAMMMTRLTTSCTLQVMDVDTTPVTVTQGISVFIFSSTS